MERVQPSQALGGFLARLSLALGLVVALVVTVAPSASADEFADGQYRCTWNQVDDEGVYLGGNVESDWLTFAEAPLAFDYCQANAPGGDFYGLDWIDWRPPGAEPGFWVMAGFFARSTIPLAERPGWTWNGDFGIYNPEPPPPDPDPTELDVLYGISDRLDSVNGSLVWLSGVGALVLFTSTVSMVVLWAKR